MSRLRVRLASAYGKTSSQIALRCLRDVVAHGASSDLLRRMATIGLADRLYKVKHSHEATELLLASLTSQDREFLRDAAVLWCRHRKSDALLFRFMLAVFGHRSSESFDHVDALLQALVALLVGEPRRDPPHVPIEDRQDVGAGGHRVERACEPVLVIDEHAVRQQRLIAAGMLTTQQICKLLGVKRSTIRRRHAQGLVEARICNELGEWLYWPPKQIPAWLACPCGGRRSVVAVVVDAAMAHALLAALGLPCTPATFAPARDPPQTELWFADAS